jgi:hypothetical protein
MAREKHGFSDYRYQDQQVYDNHTAVATETGRPGGYDDEDVFGHEEGHDVCSD